MSWCDCESCTDDRKQAVATIRLADFAQAVSLAFGVLEALSRPVERPMLTCVLCDVRIDEWENRHQMSRCGRCWADVIASVPA